MNPIELKTDKEINEAFSAMLNPDLTEEEKVNMLADMMPEEPMPSYVPSEEDEKLETEGETVTVTVDSEGRRMHTGTASVEIRGIDSIISSMDSKPEVTAEKVFQVLNDDYEFKAVTMEDAAVFAKLTNRYMNGEKFSYYQESPQSIRDAALVVAGKSAIGKLSSAQAKNAAITFLFEDIIRDVLTNKTFYDLHSEISAASLELIEQTADKAADINSSWREKIIIDYVTYANAAREKGNDEKADTYLGIREKFIESYELKGFEEFIRTKHPRLKAMHVKEDKMFAKRIDDWGRKYATSEEGIAHPAQIVRVLRDVYDCKGPYETEDIRRLMLVWFEYTYNLVPSNIIDHTLMYYFFYNITNLKGSLEQHLHGGDVEFFGKFKERLEDLIILIKELYTGVKTSEKLYPYEPENKEN